MKIKYLCPEYPWDDYTRSNPRGDVEDTKKHLSRSKHAFVLYLDEKHYKILYNHPDIFSILNHCCPYETQLPNILGVDLIVKGDSNILFILERW